MRAFHGVVRWRHRKRKMAATALQPPATALVLRLCLSWFQISYPARTPSVPQKMVVVSVWGGSPYRGLRQFEISMGPKRSVLVIDKLVVALVKATNIVFFNGFNIVSSVRANFRGQARNRDVVNVGRRCCRLSSSASDVWAPRISWWQSSHSLPGSVAGMCHLCFRSDSHARQAPRWTFRCPALSKPRLRACGVVVAIRPSTVWRL